MEALKEDLALDKVSFFVLCVSVYPIPNIVLGMSTIYVRGQLNYSAHTHIYIYINT